jgi:hypothetical protein
MRKVVLLVFFILTFINNEKVYSRNPQIDTCLVGTWSGSEKGEQWEGVQKNWVQYRYPDGKLITKFTTTQFGIVDVFTETGKWWTKNGKFYEKRVGARKPDVYTYEIADKNHIIFKSSNLPKKFKNKIYQFVDTRVEDDKTTEL